MDLHDWRTTGAMFVLWSFLRRFMRIQCGWLVRWVSKAELCLIQGKLHEAIGKG